MLVGHASMQRGERIFGFGGSKIVRACSLGFTVGCVVQNFGFGGVGGVKFWAVGVQGGIV